ncbi:MAG TPA: peptide chain release factor N(5)-glutamine methyltransferase [Chloroflexota bacterium]|nr:peptide chain release factor N(5)-glutamine methyltransferase [Chloroflexota bacterium]
MDLGEALRLATERLGPLGGEARLEARLLLEFVLGRSRTWLYQHLQSNLSPAQLAHLNHLVEARLGGEPLAYLLGKREFYGRDFKVDRRVLIPRPETEALIESALAFLRTAGLTRPRIVDVGTGSGAIAVTIAAEVPAARVIAVDRSADALAVARENARQYGVLARVRFVQGDLLAGLAGPFDLILANLPYIPTAEIARLQPEVRREPRGALDGGADGLDLYRRLFAQARDRLATCGALFGEIAFNQGASATRLARQALPEYAVTIERDLAGQDRLLAARPRVALSRRAVS